MAIADLHFSIAANEFVSIVGPSGCGKTTMLRIIAGLLSPTSGEVLLEGRRVTGPPKEMVLVFQDYSRSLCAWLSVLRNVLFALETVPISRQEKEQRAITALRTVGLEEFAHHYPLWRSRSRSTLPRSSRAASTPRRLQPLGRR